MKKKLNLFFVEMHKSHHGDLTLHDDHLTDDERNAIHKSMTWYLVFWVLNVLVIIYVIIRLFWVYEAFFVGYIIFNTLALIASIAFLMKYKTWYGGGILTKIILVLFIISTIVFFIVILVVEFAPIDRIAHLKRGHEHWIYTALRIVFFAIPVLHSLCIICLWWQRSAAERRIENELHGTKAKGRLTLSYKPQVDDNERNVFKAVKNHLAK